MEKEEIKELQMNFTAVKIGDRIYAVIEKEHFQLEELEKTWVITQRELPGIHSASD
jgi:hypothetical protein